MGISPPSPPITFTCPWLLRGETKEEYYCRVRCLNFTKKELSKNWFGYGDKPDILWNNAKWFRWAELVAFELTI